MAISTDTPVAEDREILIGPGDKNQGHFEPNRKSLRVVLFVRQGSQGSTFRGRFSRKPSESNRRLGIQNTFVDHPNVGLRAPGCGRYGSRNMIFQSFSKKNRGQTCRVELCFYGVFSFRLSRGRVKLRVYEFEKIQIVSSNGYLGGFVPPCILDLYYFRGNLVP